MLRDQLRSTIFDGAGTGVVLVGNERLNEQFARERASGRYAQLISRFGQRVNSKKPFQTDVDMLLDGWDLQGAEARQAATGVAMLPGHLRQMNKTLRIAWAVSDMRGEPEPTARDIETAWKHLGGVL